MIEVLPILTERLTLRKFREDDAVAFHGWRNDPAVARYTLWDCPYPIEEAERFCHEQASLAPFPEGAYYQLMIVEKATGGPVGDIGVGNGVTPEGLGNVRIGYTLSPKGQGKGYMTEALRALLPALVTPLKVSKFSADIDVRNPASGRVHTARRRIAHINVSREFRDLQGRHQGGQECPECLSHIALALTLRAERIANAHIAQPFRRHTVANADVTNRSARRLFHDHQLVIGAFGERRQRRLLVAESLGFLNRVRAIPQRVARHGRVIAPPMEGHSVVFAKLAQRQPLRQYGENLNHWDDNN